MSSPEKLVRKKNKLTGKLPSVDAANTATGTSVRIGITTAAGTVGVGEGRNMTLQWHQRAPLRQQRLWKPVQLIYSKPYHSRLAQLRATVHRMAAPELENRSTEQHSGLDASCKPCQICNVCKNPTTSTINHGRQAGGSQRLMHEKEIQTEDITDAKFLSAALRKCSVSRINAAQQQSTDHSQHSHSEKRTQTEKPKKEYADNSSVSSGRSRGQLASNKSSTSIETLKSIDEIDGQSVDLSICTKSSLHSRQTAGAEKKYDNVSEMKQKQNDDQAERKSVYSNHIIHPTQSYQRKHSATTQKQGHMCHDRGTQSAQDVKTKFVNVGSCTTRTDIAERKRLQILSEAQHKYQTLLSEYNSLPVSSQTIRVRNRKLHIEHELDDIEDVINRHAKPMEDLYV